MIRTNRQTLLQATVICCVCIGYLEGLIANDMVFDFLTSREIAEKYYCDLLGSFQTYWGLARIVIPCMIITFTTVFVGMCHPNSSYRKLQRFIIGIFVFLTIPLLSVSIKTCAAACVHPATIPLDMHLIRAVHVLLFTLMSTCLFLQTKICVLV